MMIIIMMMMMIIMMMIMLKLTTEVFRAGMKKMEYKTRQWHEKCFVCCVCNKTIGTKSFIPKENDIYCTACYEDKFATKCIACNKVRT